MAILVRKNTAIFNFSDVPGGVPRGDFWYSGCLQLLRQMKIPNNEVASVDLNEYLKEIIVKFSTDEIFSTRMDQFGGSIPYQQADGNTYQVQVYGRQAAPRRTNVKIRWVPQEMSLDVLRKELEPFGRVEGMSRFRIDEDYKVLTERVTATITLLPSKHIPSFLMVEGRKLRVFYLGQPPTCMICASPEHMATSCIANRRRRWEDTAAVQQQQQQQQQQQPEQQQQQQQGGQEVEQ